MESTIGNVPTVQHQPFLWQACLTVDLIASVSTLNAIVIGGRYKREKASQGQEGQDEPSTQSQCPSGSRR
jgi:hypothetical protein